MKENLIANLIANLPDENGRFFEIRYRKKQYFIRHYNSELKQDVAHIHEVDKETIVKVFVLNKKLHFIELAGNKISKKAIFTIYYQSDSSLQFKSEPLFSINYKDIGFMTKLEKFIGNNSLLSNNRLSDENNHPFALTISRNQKYYALSFDDFSKKKESFRFYLIANNHQIIFEKLLELPQKDKTIFL